MKKKCKFLFILVFVIVLIFYMDNSVVAMAAELNIELAAESESGPVVESDEEQSIESAPESVKPEQNIDSIVESEPEQSTESVAEAEPEMTTEPVSELESESVIEHTDASNMETAQDFVSTGPALIEWLESHKNTGGTVKLVDHVVLDGYYCYCPNGVNRPSVFVNTDKYTITVTGEIEFMSDSHLTFSGQPDGRSIFYVAEHGMLSMLGVAVESGQCALWQEEGAGLVIEDCHISGSIHYADTPFVMYQSNICVIMENGQTINDVVPAQISCTVNRQGQLSHNELVPITWHLEEAEMQQEERQRFQMQGSFLYAASAEPVLCTVIYNVYPLTITDVKASVSGNRYTFQGGYKLSKESLPFAVMSEESFPITVMSEYSFDNKNWFMYERQKVSSTYESFFIAFKSEEWDMSAHPNVYIRLQCNGNGAEYFSNVLCFASDNLEHAEDIGGSRGGGTSIINPPEQPQESTGDTYSKEEPTDIENNNTNSGNTESGAPSVTNQTEKGNDDINSNSASEGQALNTEVPNADAGQTLYSTSPNINEEQSLDTESEIFNAGQPSYTETENEDNVRNADASDIKDSINRIDSYVLGKKEDAVADSSVYGENRANAPAISERTMHSDILQGNIIIIITGFVLMAASAGIVGFFVHSRSGTNR